MTLLRENAFFCLDMNTLSIDELLRSLSNVSCQQLSCVTTIDATCSQICYTGIAALHAQLPFKPYGVLTFFLPFEYVYAGSYETRVYLA